MAPEDKEKIAFITDCGLFCYRIMPLSLENAGATYQRLVNKVFKEHIGHNIEVYVDNILIKNHALENHVNDLEETFIALCKYQMKLNLAK